MLCSRIHGGISVGESPFRSFAGIAFINIHGYTDVPALLSLAKQRLDDYEDVSLLVITRVQKRAQKEEASDERSEHESGVCPSSVTAEAARF